MGKYDRLIREELVRLVEIRDVTIKENYGIIKNELSHKVQMRARRATVVTENP